MREDKRSASNVRLYLISKGENNDINVKIQPQVANQPIF